MGHQGGYSSVPLSCSDSDTDPAKHRPYPSPTMLRRTSLLLDGMARVALFPFGPRLIHRLTFHKDWQGAMLYADTTTWSQITYPVAIATGAYTVGRALGGRVAAYFPVAETRLPQRVATLGGVLFALHLFQFGAGLGSVFSLVWMRFLSSLVAGYCCQITDSSLPEDKAQLSHHVVPQIDSAERLMEEGVIQRTPSDDSTASRSSQARAAYFYVAPGAAKMYITGSTISILVGGLLYSGITESIVFQAYAGGYPFTLSPVFFVTVMAFVVGALRTVFWLASGCEYGDDGVKPSPMHNQSGAVRRLVSRVVSRRVQVALKTPDRRGSRDYGYGDPLTRSRHRNGSGHVPARSRVNSARSETSFSEFFDCNSAFSDEMMDLDADPFTGDSQFGVGAKEACAVYVDSQTVYPDGSPAFVPHGECIADTPQNYLEVCGGNRDKAQKMWLVTQKWRREKDVWKTHRIPHPFFQEIKRAYPHFIHGHSKEGFPIIYEQPGRMNLKDFFRSGGEISEMVRHYTFMMEYIANCVVVGDEVRALCENTSAQFDTSSWGTMAVLDVHGASVRSLSGDVVWYLKEAGEINSSHYPNRLKRAFVVNSPFWLAGVFSTIKGVLPESVHIDILSSGKYMDCLRKYIEDDQIPKEYGGSSPYPLGKHPYEVKLGEMVQRAAGFDDDKDDVIMDLFPQETGHASDKRLNLYLEGKQDRGLTWSHEVAASPMKSQNSAPIRRRTSSHDRARTTPFPSTIDEEYVNVGDGTESTWEQSGILIILSCVYPLWCAVQGALEVAVPLWILTPPVLGGLGYAPSRSGVALFSASVVVLRVMRTKVVRTMAQMPIREPMRAFRIGVGSETALLVLMPLIPAHVTSIARSDSVLAMTSTIILLACMAIASMLGTTAASVLHRMAALTYSAKSTQTASPLTERMHHKERLLSDCRTGKLTARLRNLGEVVGIVAVAPLYSWSTIHHRPFPFDGACSFYVAALATFVLYVSSFSLFINVDGEFAPHPRDGCSDAMDTRRCCSFVGEVVAVSAGDMASLLEEANWSSSPLLGYCPRGSRDKRSSAMELGEASTDYTTKRI